MFIPTSWGIAVAHVLSVCVAGIGALSLAGYIRHGTHAWVGDTPMALDTAIAITATGVAMFIIATIVDRHVRQCRKSK
jgi:hypothetical protein